ncbi:MAG: hypothetical protein IJX92_06570 [Clostridia bacterium]|nr:hypothetical protein [Clostridia bacterium]
MQENRNASFCQGGTGAQNNGTVCIDTMRVLDCCRDRDCFEDQRVYLTACGEQILANASNVRTRSANLLWAFVGVDEVPFNCGFFQVTVRYYIEVDFEACTGVGRSQTFKGLAALEKNVILYGGEGRALTFSSSPKNTYCSIKDFNTAGDNDPKAIVETVEPIVLGTKVSDCNCPCPCSSTEYHDIPEGIRNSLGDELVLSSEGTRIFVSFGIFSVIRIVRPAQLLVHATDYSVPDKECTDATNNDNPCALFRNIAFPISQFRGTDAISDQKPQKPGGSCGCK